MGREAANDARLWALLIVSLTGVIFVGFLGFRYLNSSLLGPQKLSRPHTRTQAGQACLLASLFYLLLAIATASRLLLSHTTQACSDREFRCSLRCSLKFYNPLAHYGDVHSQKHNMISSSSVQDEKQVKGKGNSFCECQHN